jgi:hypothetical protein
LKQKNPEAVGEYKDHYTIEVQLNGTDENPFHKYGLRQNPFPQIARREIIGYLLQLAKLGADPIPDTEYIRSTLKGWSSEFVEGLCARFVKGQYIKFLVSFPK